jgi:hypothetical protein
MRGAAAERQYDGHDQLGTILIAGSPSASLRLGQTNVELLLQLMDLVYSLLATKIGVK